MAKHQIQADETQDQEVSIQPITITLGHGVDYEQAESFAVHAQDDPEVLREIATRYNEQLIPSWGLTAKGMPFGKEGEIKIRLIDDSAPEGRGYQSLGSFLPGGIVADRFSPDENGVDQYVESVFYPYAQLKEIKYVCRERQEMDKAKNATNNEQASRDTSHQNSTAAH